MWNVTDWQKVVFSDESRFVLGTDDNRVRVCRHPGPFLNGLPGAIFQQDNARPHTARVAQDILRHFQTLPWPARSPELSPVEHVWDQLKRQMPSCHSVHDLELAVQDLCAHLPRDNIRCLINSMPDRVAACTAGGGGPTPRNVFPDRLRSNWYVHKPIKGAETDGMLLIILLPYPIYTKLCYAVLTDTFVYLTLRSLVASLN
ncbi:transposable element Tcb2 transposase [Trichonephila clavipes]|nr:transposable element Tcb2 transposase [Trichonephila clavipes]